jgi:hypothetical protein
MTHSHLTNRAVRKGLAQVLNFHFRVYLLRVKKFGQREMARIDLRADNRIAADTAFRIQLMLEEEQRERRLARRQRVIRRLNRVRTT